MNRWILSCKKATELMEKRLLMDLSWKERLLLFMHTSMCDVCRIYKQQSKWLDEVLFRHFNDQNDEKITFIENDDLKKRIISNF